MELRSPSADALASSTKSQAHETSPPTAAWCPASRACKLRSARSETFCSSTARHLSLIDPGSHRRSETSHVSIPTQSLSVVTGSGTNRGARSTTRADEHGQPDQHKPTKADGSRSVRIQSRALGVKGSQVQILSARPLFGLVRGTLVTK